jgi:hypothetical protein
MESVFAGILAGGDVVIIVTLIMALAAIGVVSLSVIAISVWRRKQTDPKSSAGDGPMAGRSPSCS